MKTLKRIGLFLWLKLTEIFTIEVLLFILAIGTVMGFIYLLAKYAPSVLLGGLVLGTIYVIYQVSKDLMIENWREVKRRIP